MVGKTSFVSRLTVLAFDGALALNSRLGLGFYVFLDDLSAEERKADAATVFWGRFCQVGSIGDGRGAHLDLVAR